MILYKQTFQSYFSKNVNESNICDLSTIFYRVLHTNTFWK